MDFGADESGECGKGAAAAEDFEEGNCEAADVVFGGWEYFGFGGAGGSGGAAGGGDLYVEAVLGVGGGVFGFEGGGAGAGDDGGMGGDVAGGGVDAP